MTRYNRTPSPAFQALLAPGGFLSPILMSRTVAGLLIDVHLREKDHLNVYCGLTSLLEVSLVGREVRIGANSAYTAQSCGSGLFRVWATDEQGLSEALECYFAGVSVGERWFCGEGAVQAIWARVRDPWTPFDREAVLGYEDDVDQTSGRAFSQVQTARDEIRRIPPVKRPWAAMPVGKVETTVRKRGVSTARSAVVRGQEQISA
jgi:hypothetical protein